MSYIFLPVVSQGVIDNVQDIEDTFYVQDIVDYPDELTFLSLANNQGLTLWIRTMWTHTNRDKVRPFKIIIIAQH